jgi:hypothetical protein
VVSKCNDQNPNGEELEDTRKSSRENKKRDDINEEPISASDPALH